MVGGIHLIPAQFLGWDNLRGAIRLDWSIQLGSERAHSCWPHPHRQFVIQTLCDVIALHSEQYVCAMLGANYNTVLSYPAPSQTFYLHIQALAMASEHPQPRLLVMLIDMLPIADVRLPIVGTRHLTPHVAQVLQQAQVMESVL